VGARPALPTVTAKSGVHVFYESRTFAIESGGEWHAGADRPIAQDLIDIAIDVIPVSLRSDNIHLNAVGYTIVGQLIAAKITALGY
jgi:lysophospholipase L1-like esterase